MFRKSLVIAAVAASVAWTPGAFAAGAAKPVTPMHGASGLPRAAGVQPNPGLSAPSAVAPAPGSVGAGPGGLGAGKLAGCAGQVPRPPGC
jgi:hypothetical protein